MTARSNLAWSSVVGAVLIAGLSGCTPADSGPGDPSSTGSSGEVSANPSASPDPAEDPSPSQAGGQTFVAPSTCTDLVGPELTAKFLADGITLFTNDDGSGEQEGVVFSSTQKSGTPFSCWYLGSSIESAFEIAVQPLTHDAHEATLAALHEGGFAEKSDGEVVTFSQVGNFVAVGDPSNVESIVHVLYPNGWITLAALKGGAAQFAEINSRLPIVISRVYP
jgi:hypothetical protein